MAAAKKPVAVATSAETADVKAVAAPAAEVKAEKPAKKETVKKETAKKAPAKKAELKSVVELQVAGNSYTNDDLVKIAKDVWKYDLQQKAADLTSVELYVKAEEKKVYYVMNKDFTGSFDI